VENDEDKSRLSQKRDNNRLLNVRYNWIENRERLDTGKIIVGRHPNQGILFKIN